ncbi:mRNA surveillance protein pelota [Candidatus Woesearchaeota archaeon CG10_big_fil_rev_8_21_14_0_10_34_8]|nr:MAG: mRNA surveillance protein pelota [Candidatus Woesearchaeota archaeon CG10_big_fil_rev_8_21_14_0_10_34_8]
MKIIHRDLRHGKVKVKIDNLDDLWYLSAIIDEKDRVSGKTERKIKIGGSTDRSQKVARKQVYLAVEVEKIEFHKYANILRVSGKITDGPEDVSRGTYHTFNLEQETIIEITKQHWLRYQVDKLKEASEIKQTSVVICIVDREDAHFALMKKYGYEYLTSMQGNVQKKDSPEKIKSTFYADVIKQLEEYNQRYNLDKIIIASPGFWKQYLQEQMKKSQIAKKIILVTCSTVSKRSFEEVLKREETISALKDDHIVKDINLVEEVLKEIMKDGNVAYGIRETKKAAQNGAVKEFLITDTLIQKKRQDNTFNSVERAMKDVDTAKGNVHIISSDHEGGKKLDGLGGIAALLRYKVNY